jgi:hypothetical protein
MNRNHVTPAGLLIAIGVALAGWFVGQGFVSGRIADRYVTVKGVAERDVQADLALWPISFVATDDDLARAQRAIERGRREILAFLGRSGIDSTQVELQGLEVNDLLANPYRSGPAESRYIITQTLMVRSEEPERIQAASQGVGDLVAAGVVFSSSGGRGSGPTYLFTGLNDHKPAMIAEATASAREAAQQFAADSGSRLGPIRKARQGVFVILPRDRAAGIMEESQLHKTLRVVTTVEYSLAD